LVEDSLELLGILRRKFSRGRPGCEIFLTKEDALEHPKLGRNEKEGQICFSERGVRSKLEKTPLPEEFDRN
jgi:hypothetical protein